MTIKDGIVIPDRMDACYMCAAYDECNFIKRLESFNEFNLTVVVQICQMEV